MHFHSADSRNGRLAAELSHSHLTFALQIWLKALSHLATLKLKLTPTRCAA